MKNQTLIRHPQPSDLPSMKTVIQETELFPPEMLDEMIKPFFDDPSSGHLWLVTEQHGEIATIAYCEPERMTVGTYNLLAIGVRASLQGQGLGQALVERLEQILSALNARILLVETMGTDEFALTRKFYSKIGFTEEARIREFYQEGGDKVVFWKSLA